MRWWIVLAAAAGLLGCAGQAPLPPKALELNKNGAQALESGDLEAAEARLELALEYNPKFVEALTNLGLVEMQRGNFGRARQLLERARRLNPDIAQPHHGLGVLAEHRRRPDIAAEHYRDALAVDPGFAAARANLGRVLFEAEMYEHAREEFRKLLQISPETVEGWTGLAESLLQLGRLTEADEIVEQGRRAFPESATLAILEARQHLRRGRYERARSLLMPRTGNRDDVAAAAFAWLATLELASGSPERALTHAQRSLDLDPGEPVARYAAETAQAQLATVGPAE